MKRLLLPWSILLLFLFCVLSCAKTNDDITPPEIGKVIINPLDTIMDRVNDVFYTINVDENAELDTLILGKRLDFKAQFSDNEALSSYLIQINVDPENEGIEGDTVFTVSKRWLNIFGMKDYFFEDQSNRDISIPDSLSYQKTDPETGVVSTQLKPVREGFYNLDIKLLDTAGNWETKQVKVRFLSRKTIFDSHSK